ncbi:flagellar hook-associated protein FlgK [Parvularcula lutaonensis]|uniref:Flagellar hook-associated protein 1 n=1 Tax=Parvularcula lutaonensis TaxID=491923 RepID=A0ABV7MCM3_9PROT|nr:flagellar hook-associated protein FlgK [Parvularcula lutaonensis]GGY50721.1 flagellar hook-associated protein [Parvularcula lutaonensis]
MSLTTALYNAKSGLNSTQRQVAGASDNIANARTPGYVAKDARISANNIAGIGSGVSADMVRSPVDSILLRDVRLEAAKLGTLDVRATAVGRLASVIGDPADARSIPSAFTALETAFQDLYDAPERTDLQQAVFFAAQDLTARFGSAEDAIQTAREEADRSIAAGVQTVNDALQGIADLNLKVAEAMADPSIDASGIMDERDRLIDIVAEQIGIRTFTRAQGEVVISTTEGVTLLDGQPRTLGFTQTSTISPGTRITNVPTVLSGLTVDGFDISPGPLGGPQALRTGSLAGHFLARDVDLVQYQDQIDALAKETAVLFQQADKQVAAQRYGFFTTGAVPPNPAIAGLFTDAGAAVDPLSPAANIEGLAGRLSVNALVDPNAPGGDLTRLRTGVVATFDPNASDVDFSTFPPTQGGAAYANPTAPTLVGFQDQIQGFLDGLAQTRTFTPSGGLAQNNTLGQFASEFTSGVQNNRANLESLADRTRTIFDTLEIRRFNENGVNIDEESEKLLELEQAYTANAQVINIIARMFDELLARLA